MSETATVTAVATVPPPPPKEEEQTPAQILGLHEFIINDNQGYKLHAADGFVFYKLLQVPKGKPYIAWCGARMPMALWHTILAFFEWSQRTHKSESQVRLYITRPPDGVLAPRDGEWRAWAFPQKCIGMTTEEIADHPTWEENERMIPPGFICIGTVHHHCTGGAFQSGTDTWSERNNNNSRTNGIHITVGGITTPKYSIHARVVLNGAQDDAVLGDWFELPDMWRELPDEAWAQAPANFKDDLIKASLLNPPPATATFPDQWKANCYPFVSGTHGYQTGSGSVSVGNSSGHWVYINGVGYKKDDVRWENGRREVWYHNRWVPDTDPCLPRSVKAYDSAHHQNGGTNGPFVAGAASTGTPGSGAATSKDDKDDDEPAAIGVKGRVLRALKNLNIDDPDIIETQFLAEMDEAMTRYNVDNGRLLELAAMMIADEKRIGEHMIDHWKHEGGGYGYGVD